MVDVPGVQERAEPDHNDISRRGSIVEWSDHLGDFMFFFNMTTFTCIFVFLFPYKFNPTSIFRIPNQLILRFLFDENLHSIILRMIGCIKFTKYLCTHVKISTRILP